MVMYKIDRRGGGVQKSLSRKLPKTVLFKRIPKLNNLKMQDLRILAKKKMYI